MSGRDIKRVLQLLGHTLHTGSAFVDCMEDAGCAIDGRIQKVSLNIGHIEVERACGMNDSFERRVRDNHFIEGTGVGDVRDDGKIEPVAFKVRIYLLDAFRLGMITHSGDDRVTVH
jgi:hypothetical protein